jgi:ATP synthase protein I
VSKAALELTRAAVWRWLVIQIAVVVLLALIFLFFQGMGFAGSVLLGGAISILPNGLFARWWFSYFKAKAATRLVGKFYVGEIAKLVLTIVLFIAAFEFLPLHVIGCLLGYVVAQMAFWIAPLLG